MTLRHSISSNVVRVRPLAACLALALATPASTLLAAAPSLGAAQPASAVRPAATTAVTSCADDGSPGTLRSVVAAAATGDTIDLTQLSCASITLASGSIAITQNDLTLNGPGAAALTISGGGTSRVFAHNGTGILAINGLGIAHGYANGIPGACVYSAGSIALNASTVSSCSMPATSYAPGGGIYAAGSVALTASTVSGNHGYRGGGLYAKGNVTLTTSTVSGNSAFISGGIVSHGSTFTMIGSTVSGNTANDNLGGIFAYPVPASSSATAVVTNSTISGNVSGNVEGGAYFNMPLTLSNSTIAFNRSPRGCSGLTAGNHAYTVNLQSSILSDNVPTSGRPCDFLAGASVVVSGANNLVVTTLPTTLALPSDTIRSEPLLLPLANNGGPTQTHALQAGSPAINHGNNALDLAYDQRGPGFPRLIGSASDIGAYEVQPIAGVTVTQNFAPSAMRVGSLSTLTISLVNGETNAAALTASLIDSLPASMILANPPNASTTCAGGSLTAVAGGSTITLGAGAQIPASSQVPIGGSCSINVSVTALSAGSLVNSIAAGDLQTSAGNNTNTSNATLTVTGQSVAPSVDSSFAPGTVQAGGVSTLTLTLANVQAAAATLTADLTDTLPSGLVVANPANAVTSCPSGVVTANSGANSVVLASGAAVPGGTCTVTLSVTSNTIGTYVNTIAAGALQTNFGNNHDATSSGLIVTVNDTIFADGFDGSVP